MAKNVQADYWHPCSVKGCHCEGSENLHVETSQGVIYGPRKAMEQILEARGLLRQVLPFIDTGHDCLICGATPNKVIEHSGCPVPRIEKLVDRGLFDGDERTAKCEHRADGVCDYCLISAVQKPARKSR